MNTSELRDIATVVAALVALMVFAVNSFFQLRNRRIDNLTRFIEAHRKLFSADGYILKNVDAMNAGTLKRDRENVEMERKFHDMLLDVERLALLGNNNAVPRQTQVYMFGWYARHIGSIISDEERKNIFWELGLNYLDRLTKATIAYEALAPAKLSGFWGR
jgi:hypothetical protein